MILRIEQTKTNFSMEWNVTNEKNGLYALVKSPFEKGRFMAHFFINDKNTSITPSAILYQPNGLKSYFLTPRG